MIDLGAGADETNRKRENKTETTQTARLPTLTYLSHRRKSEARSRIMLSAGGMGAGGWAGEAGKGRGSADVREQPRHHGEAGGAADQEAGPWLGCWSSRQLAHWFVYCRYFFSRAWSGASSLSPPFSSPAWFLTKFSFQGHKEKNNSITSTLQSDHPHLSSHEGTSMRAGGRGRREGVGC